MTPREPDRFEARALELYRYCKRELGTDQPASYDCPHPSVDDVAAALRAEHASALERAAREAEALSSNYDKERALIADSIADAIRALIPPAAAPAGWRTVMTPDGQEVLLSDAAVLILVRRGLWPTSPAAAPAAECMDHWHCDPATAAHACKANRSAPCPTCHAAPAAETGKAQAIEININDSVWVKVTAVGEQVYRQHWIALRMDPLPLRRDADGWTKFQLWELANVFGAAMYNGGSVPVETTIRLATPAPAQGAEAHEDRDLAEDWQDRCETAQARIAELEALVAEANRQIAKLAARAAPPEGEGT